MKRKVNKLDVDKLVPVPVHLSKLGEVLKSDVYNDVYNAKRKNIEDKIPVITNLATNTTLNAKINEVKNEILTITNLANTAALNAKIKDAKNKIPGITDVTAAENKILNVSNLVRKLTITQ